mmetsp:Transcript_3789/g.4332  ORF Transcript_3789/g.4332 Transcript_3789/m.4332 type:complete len:830 (-) Transcript_3789:511-3000(-)
MGNSNSSHRHETKSIEKNKDVKASTKQQQSQQKQQKEKSNKLMKSPLLEPEIEEDVSDIDEPEDQEEEMPSLMQYLSMEQDGGTSPTGTDSSYDRSFGIDSFDSLNTPQKNVFIDTNGMVGSGTPKSTFSSQKDEIDGLEHSANMKTPTSLYSIREHLDQGECQKPLNDTHGDSPTSDDNDCFSLDDVELDLQCHPPENDAASPPLKRDLFKAKDEDNRASQTPDKASLEGEVERNNPSASDDDKSIGGDSFLSQDSEYDNVSTSFHSVADESLTSIPSIILKNAQRNSINGGSFFSSSSSVKSSSSKSVHSSCSYSIYNRRCSMKRSRSEGSKNKRPNATNAFETLPKHLIKTGLVRQVAATLRDERFICRRIEKLGSEYASKIHVSDFELLRKRDKKNTEKLEKERDAKGGGLEAALPSAQTFAEGDDFFNVMIDSFDMFLKCILEMCGVFVDDIIYEDEDCDEFLECEEPTPESTLTPNNNKQDDDQDISTPDQCNHNNEKKTCLVEPHNDDDNKKDSMDAQHSEPKLSPLEGGIAILNIGKFLQGREWIDDAMHYYRHAMYLFLLEIDVEENRLLDDSEDCDGLFYVDIATEGAMVSSPALPFLGTVSTKIGDVHGKNSEVNDALRAYRAAQVFWSKHLTDHKVTNEVKRTYNDDDPDELDEYAASVEGLALALNRVGGVFTSKGDLKSALKTFHEALDLQIDALGDVHLEVAKTIHNIGVCHRHNDDWDQALEYYGRAHCIFEVVKGKDHLDTVRTLHNIGGVHRRRKSYDEAMICFKEVLRVRRNLLGDDHPSVSIALVSIAATLRRSGRIDEANKFYAAAIN